MDYYLDFQIKFRADKQYIIWAIHMLLKNGKTKPTKPNIIKYLRQQIYLFGFAPTSLFGEEFCYDIDNGHINSNPDWIQANDIFNSKFLKGKKDEYQSIWQYR